MMNEACCILMSFVPCDLFMWCHTHEWGMSHINESCHTSMRHVTYSWGTPHINETCQISMSCETHEFFIWRQMKNSVVLLHSTTVLLANTRLDIHTIHRQYELWDTSIVHLTSHTHMNEMCRTSMRHVTCQWGKSHINEWVVSSYIKF